jgi:CheY-like chemotaxis protein
MNTINLHCSMKADHKTDRPKTILVVDDNISVSKMIVMSLRRLGHYNLAIATSGKQALEMVDHACPDLVIIDINMPGMDGIETAREIATRHSCAIIFSTGLWDTDTLQRSRDVASAAYLVKPFSAAQLQAAVHLADNAPSRNAPALEEALIS